MRYYLGLSSEKPEVRALQLRRESRVLGAGLGHGADGRSPASCIWAKVWVGNLLARWWVDVATAIHYYEAILATLAIVVWHFYQVFFDPDVYPMNWAWRDGKMPLDHYREEHGLDTEASADKPGAQS